MSLHKGGVCVAILALLAAMSPPLIASSVSEAVACDVGDSEVDRNLTPEECPPGVDATQGDETGVSKEFSMLDEEGKILDEWFPDRLSEAGITGAVDGQIDARLAGPGGSSLAPKQGLFQSEQPQRVPTALYSTGFFYPMHRDGPIQAPAAGSWRTDTAYLSSWALDAALRIDRIGFRVNAAAAKGATADIAIYRDNGRARARELVHSVTGIPLATTGAKSQIVDWELPAGVYWVETTLHGNVTALVLEAIPVQGGHFPAPISVSGSTPAAAAVASGVSRTKRSGAPSEVHSAETLGAARYIPRLWFRPLLTATPGTARWHDSDTENAGLRNYSQVVTPEHISIEDDPVLGDIRSVMRLSTAEGDTSLTANPRTQLAPHTSVAIGSEFWVGFGLMIPEDFPATWNNSYFMTVAEMYGAPYGGNSPFRFTIMQGGDGIALCATRSSAFSAGPANVWVKPLAGFRGKWIDIVLHGVLSTDPGVGYYELFTNEGSGFVQQQLAGVNRLHGASVVVGVNDGTPNSFHLKNYRQAGSPVKETTIYFANHRVGVTFDEVNPHSYD